MNVKRFLSLLSMVAMVAYLVPTVYAANLTAVKDTLSNSAPSESSDHAFEFTTATLVPASGSVVLTFPILATEFDMTTATMALGDFDMSIATVDQTIVSGAPGASEIGLDLTNITNGEITFDLGSSVTIPASSAVTIDIGKNASGGANQIENPSAEGPYSIVIATYDASSGALDSQNDVVHINNTVTVTATVQSSLTFAINGQTSGTACANAGGNADVTTTSTTIPFGNLATSTPKIACQELIVSTNATNGYVVTLQQNNDLTSSGADTFPAFSGTHGTPVTWASPPGTGTNAYFGFTTDDTGYSQFQTSKYSGFAANDTPYNIVTEAGPVSNETNIISYEVEVNALQEAGTYTNTLMYICTATF